MSDSTQWFESLRVSYEQGELNESEVNHNPLDHFNKWLQEAIKNQVPAPNAMVLSTVNKDGQLGARWKLKPMLDIDHVQIREDLARTTAATLMYVAQSAPVEAITRAVKVEAFMPCSAAETK